MEDYYLATRVDVFDLIPENAGRVLDVGGGVGATAGYLRAQGRASYAVLADRVDGEPAPGVDEVISGNLEDPEFVKTLVMDKGPFDTILCLDVLEHLRDPWALIEQLHQALAPRGVIVSSIPNVNYIGLVGPLVVQGRYELKDSGILDRTHVRWFNKAGAIDLMTGSGLELDSVFERIPDGKWKTINKLTLGLFKRFFVLQNCIKVRRAA